MLKLVFLSVDQCLKKKRKRKKSEMSCEENDAHRVVREQIPFCWIYNFFFCRIIHLFKYIIRWNGKGKIMKRIIRYLKRKYKKKICGKKKKSDFWIKYVHWTIAAMIPRGKKKKLAEPSLINYAVRKFRLSKFFFKIRIFFFL